MTWETSSNLPTAEEAVRDSPESEEGSDLNWCLPTYNYIINFIFLSGFILSVLGNSLVVKIYWSKIKTHYSFLVFIIAVFDLLFTVVVLPLLVTLRLWPGILGEDRTLYNITYYTPILFYNLLTVQLCLFVALQRFHLYSHTFARCSPKIRILIALTFDACLVPVPYVLLRKGEIEALKVVFLLVEPALIVVGTAVVLWLNVRVMMLVRQSVHTHHRLTGDVRRARLQILLSSPRNGQDQGMGEQKRVNNRSRLTEVTGSGTGAGTGTGVGIGGSSGRVLGLMGISREERSMLVALVAATTVSCAFCAPRVEFMVEYVLGYKPRSRSCILRVAIDFVAYFFNYMNYASSPIIYYMVSSSFREDTKALFSRLTRFVSAKRKISRASTNASNLSTRPAKANNNSDQLSSNCHRSPLVAAREKPGRRHADRDGVGDADAVAVAVASEKALIPMASIDLPRDPSISGGETRSSPVPPSEV